VIKHGLPGGHHFYIAFRTAYPLSLIHI